VTVRSNIVNEILYFFLKTDISQMASITLSNAAAKVYDNTLAGFVPAGDRYYFGLIDNQSNKNFQSYYLQIDLCITRDGSHVCTQCPTGYYRNNLAANNLCITKASFPAGYGADDSIFLMRACQIATCNSCIDDYTTCAGCNVPGGYFQNLSTGICTHTSAIPNGFGGNATDGVIWPCSVSNCLICNTNSAACLGCDVAIGYFKDNSTGLCVLVGLIPQGFGGNATDGSIWPCGISNCQTCNSNSSACSQCNVAGGYYKNNATGLCVHTSAIPNGFGGNATDGSIWPCQVSDCHTCNTDISLCILCNTAGGFFKDNSTGLCVHTSSIGNGFGGNNTDGSIWPCSDLHCVICQANSALCTTCDLASQYFRNPATSVCVFITSIPAGKGANVSTGIFESCWTPNCQTCQSDSLVCDQCKTATQYYMNTTDRSCVHYLAIIDSYGAGITTGTIRPCDEGHCLKCKADKAVCTGCDTANLYYLNATSKSCILQSSIIDRFGSNLANGQITDCADANCLNCRLNYLTCAACDTSSLYYLDTTTQTCILQSSIPTGYGADLSTGTIAQCSDVLCMYCQANHAVCSGCDTGSGYYLNTTSNVCILNSLITTGFGAKLSDGTIAACVDGHCQICSMNNLQCSSCDTANYYFLDTATLLCVLNSSIASGSGPSLSTGRIELCTDTHCLDCRATIGQCQGCDTANHYFLNTTSKTCVLDTDILSGFGADLPTGTVLACSDAHCLSCQADRSICDTCDTGNNYYKNTSSSQCVLKASIINGFGADLISGVIAPCADASCSNCRNNFQICAGCDTSTGHYLDTLANSCVHFTAIGDFFGADQSTGLVVSCAIANCKLCKANASSCLGCDVASSYYQNPSTLHCTYVSNIPGGQGANSTTGFYEPCWTSHCVDCQLDSTTCTTCDVGVLYYLDPATHHCLLNMAIPDFYGANILTGLVTACVDPHCRNCKSNINYCSFCDTASSYFYDTSTSTCIIQSSIPPAFGADPATSLVKPCVSAGCTDCQANFLTCVQCDNAATYFLDTSSHQCILVSAIPNYNGANHVSGIVSPCSGSFCIVCNLNYLVCTRCSMALDYYLDSSNTCVHVSSIPPGSGANATTGKVDDCWVAHCALCQMNSLVCTACDTATGYYLNTTSGSCVLDSSIVSGSGANQATGTVEPCADANCLNCQLDILTCTACDVALGFFLNTATHACVAKTAIPDWYGANHVTGTVVSCSDLHCKKCQANFTICTACDVVSHYFLNDLLHICILDTMIPNFYGANLTAGSISLCAVNNCKACQVNILQCTACNTNLMYFMDPLTLGCLYYLDIPDGKGADLVTGVIGPCIDANCLICKADTTVCTRCDSSNGYYLNSTINGCVALPDVTLGYGGDLVVGDLKPCLVVGCLDCRLDFSKCMVCDVAHFYYFNTSSEGCTHVDSIANGFGANLADGFLEPCFDSACQICNHDSTVCERCRVAAGYYLQVATQVCVKDADIDDFMGGNPVTGTVVPCSLSGCRSCRSLYSKCTACDAAAGKFLAIDGSGCISTFGEGFGPDLENGLVKPCADSNCKLCTHEYSVCEFCDVSKKVFLEQTGCSFLSTAPQGMGVNASSSLLVSCAVELCSDCRTDYQTCTRCHENMGYYLEGNLCVLMDAKLVVKESSDKPAGVTSKFVVVTSPQLSVDQESLYRELKAVAKWNITYLKDSTGKPEAVGFKTNMLSSSAGLFQEVTLSGMLEEKKYKVNVTSPQKYYNVSIDGTLYRLSWFTGVFPYANSNDAGSVAQAASTGSTVSNLMGSTLTSSAAFLPVMMTVVALDPTGVLMKFNQILKIINKLYFININYGSRLTPFLAAIGEMGGGTISLDADYNTKHQSSYRGKLSKARLSFDFVPAMNYRIGMFLTSWLIWLLHWSLMAMRVRVSKNYLHVMHFCRRVHLIIFNLVFIDFIWYGSHALMHSRGQPMMHQLLAFLSLFLVAVDISMVVQTVFSQRDWLYWIALRKQINEKTLEEKKLMHFEELKLKKLAKQSKKKKETKKQTKVRGRAVDLPQFAEDDPDSDQEGEKSKKESRSRPVNYTNTYDEIGSYYHLYLLMAVNLRELARVYLNPFARSLFLLHLFRTVAYQGAVMAGQYSSGLAISLLLLVEVFKIASATYFYVKYKYLKNIICLLMEVMQSSFLMAFLVIALILHPKSADEIILDFYQDAGIWIVIASCVAEYLLLLTYIGVAAYDFFKNRKAVNRALKKMKFSFIKYGVDNTFVEETNGPVFTTFDTLRHFTVESHRGNPTKASQLTPQINPSKGMPTKTIINHQVLSPRPLMKTAENLESVQDQSPLSPKSPLKTALKRSDTKSDKKKSVGWAEHLKQKLDSKSAVRAKMDDDDNSAKSTGVSDHLQGLRMAHRIGKAKLKLKPRIASELGNHDKVHEFTKVTNLSESTSIHDRSPVTKLQNKRPNPVSAFVKNLRNLKFGGQN
jgi:hypothetical protein